MRVEKPAYIRAAKPISKNTVAARLTTCATVFRLAVENGASRIKSKTANAVIDHITETLPGPDEGLLQPLQNDYLKSLRAILGWPSHGEHLRQKLWQTLADFLVSYILRDLHGNVSSRTAGSKGTESQDSRNGRFLSVRISQSSGTRSPRIDANGPANELIMSLSLLTSVTNAPLMTRAAAIVDCVALFLDSATSTQHEALVAFNNVLSRMVTEDLALARQSLSRMLPLLRRLWSLKSSALKDQILIALILGREILFDASSTTSTENDTAFYSNLFEAILNEYHRRGERDLLQLDDIVFPSVEVLLPVGLRGVAPIVESPRALSNWMVPSILSSLTVFLDRIGALAPMVQFGSETPKKRRKVANRVEEIPRQVLNSLGTERICSSQLLLFLLDESQEMRSSFAEHFSNLASLILDDDSNISSWIMLSFAR